MVKFDILKDYPNTPVWLEEALKDKDVTKLDLPQFGQTLLRRKQEYIELENQGRYAKHQLKIPLELEFHETALALIFKIPFFNILTAKTGEETILGSYVDEGPKKGVYTTDKQYFEELIDDIAPSYSPRLIEYTLNKIRRVVPKVNQSRSAHLVPVGNGIFNRKTKKLEPFSPQKVYLSKIKTNYVEDAKNPTYTFGDGVQWDVDSWINSIASNDSEIDLLLWQVISDFVQSNYTRNKSIFLYSEKGNNGKGTYGELLENIVGNENVSHLAVKDFKHEFLKEQLIGKVGNIAHENDVDDYIDSVRDFKATITGDNIIINRKYEKPMSFQFKGTNIQMFNGLPKTRDKSESFYRRILLVPFLQSFTNNGERVDIKNKFIHEKDVHEYVLNKALHLDFNEFIVPDVSKALLDQYREDNNPVIDFWSEFQDEFTWKLLPSGFLYDLFASHYERVNPTGRIMSRQSFLSQLRVHLDAIGSDWIDRTERNDKIRPGKRMDADEPLITEYNLQNWQDQTYKGKDLVKLRDFKRKNTYRGFMKDKS